MKRLKLNQHDFLVLDAIRNYKAKDFYETPSRRFLSKAAGYSGVGAAIQNSLRRLQAADYITINHGQIRLVGGPYSFLPNISIQPGDRVIYENK